MKRLLASLLPLLLPSVAVAEDADRFDAARAFCKAHDVAIYSYHEKRIGNSEGHLAPIIATTDGGFLVVGTKSDNKTGRYKIGKSRPVVIKLDGSARKVWERAYRKAGFLDHEGGSAIQISDGSYLVYIQSYVHPARGGVTRLLKLDGKGKIVWERQLRGNGGKLTPFPQSFQLTTSGSVVMKGHIYRDSSEKAYGWEGEIDASGKVKLDRIGEANPYGPHKRRR